MLSIPEELQRIWHSMVHKWNRKRQRMGGGARRWWDALILTAANAQQAAGYEMEIARRKEIGMIDPQTDVIVVPDRAGQRIGSGGATLWALKQYAEKAIRSGQKGGDGRALRKAEDLFSKRRILMMHCGGEGRRVPSNAGAGKMFATLPFEIIPGRSASAFDALYVLLCACAEQMNEGLVVCSSDVLAVLDPSTLHWRKGGCCGIGIPVPLELAARHGVYVADATGKRVADYLQKLSPDGLRAAGAVYGLRGEGREEKGDRGQGSGVGGQGEEARGQRTGGEGQGVESAIRNPQSAIAGQSSIVNRQSSIPSPDRALVDGAGILKFSPDLCARLAEIIGIHAEGRALASRKGLIEDRRRGSEGIDLYTDVAWPLVPAVTREKYCAGLSPARAFIRERLWESLRGADFWLDVIDTSLFIHLGNLWQILQAFESAGDKAQPGTSGDAAAVFGACDILASFVSESLCLNGSSHIQNSFLDGARGAVGAHSLIAECELSGQINVGARSLLRGIQTSCDLDVGDEVALFAIPIKPAGKKQKAGKTGADVAMAYCIHGLEDNPKKTLDDGLEFMGIPMREWLDRHGIADKELWPDAAGEQSLWSARLFPAGDESALPLVLWMAQSGTRNTKPGPRNSEQGEIIARWRKSERVSFADIFARIDYQAGFQQREQWAWKSLLGNIRRDLRERRDPREYLESLGAAREFIELRAHLKQWIEEEQNPITASRMLAFEADLLRHSGFSKALIRGQGSGVRGQGKGANRQSSIVNRQSSITRQSAIRNLSEPARRAMSVAAADASLRKVAKAVEMGISRTNALNLDAVRSERVVIESPARIDFGGGWTDTAPQCLERGGVILNAAVLLNGKYPIRVVGEKIEERAIRLESASSRSVEHLRTGQDLPRFQRLNDPFALLKAGLSAVGFCNQDDPQTPPVEERLSQWGHGLRLYTESNIPKGSGLGTSSALGAAVIACLRRLFAQGEGGRGERGEGRGETEQWDRGTASEGTRSQPGTDQSSIVNRQSSILLPAAFDKEERETIFRQVMYLEQLLTSAGGWQDQLGVLEPGIKLATTPSDPAFVLRPKIEPLDLDSAFLEEMNKRLVLFYVGKRRVAFNMLREIVVGYLSGNPDVVHALEAIYELAFEMREALKRRELDLFGAQMTRVRMLYRLMCAGTTSEIIEDLFAAGAPYTSGGKCVGAGGGGFIMMMARSVKDAARARERLKQFSWRGLGEFYDFAIDTRGLHQE